MVSIIAFFILICVLVFVHEYGHFWAARRCGVKVLRFSIGFGTVLFRKVDKQGTEFVFSLIPLGGYVQMWDGEENISAPKEQALQQKSLLQRAFIIIAGPAANFIFALLAYWLVFVSGIPTLKPVIGEVIPNSIAAAAKLPQDFEFKKIDGKSVADWESATLALVAKVGKAQVEIEGSHIDEQKNQIFNLDLSQWHIDGTKESPLTSLGIRIKSNLVKPEIAKVSENSVAEKAGIKSGDVILSVNGKPFNWQMLVETVQLGEPLELLISQSGVEKQISVTPEKQKQRYILGIVPKYEPLTDKYRTVLKYDILEAFGVALKKVGALVETILQFIGNLISGELSLKNMSGPISMAKGAGATAEIGWIYYLSFMALISVNLGVMNLFPILPLDGGQLVLLAAEGLKKKPLSEQVRLRFQQIGMAFVLGLMAYTLINDVIHF